MKIYSANDISHAYNRHQSVLSHVHFSLEAGSVMTLLGPNGAGKSTLIACLMGMLKPSDGEIWLDGHRISSLGARRIARLVGYVPQMLTTTAPYTALQYVLMGRAPYVGLLDRPSIRDVDAAWRALSVLSIEYLAERTYATLSGGERQQVVIARALAAEPKALVLDEPMAHLDIARQYALLMLLKRLSERGMAILVSTHNPDHALWLDGQAALLDRKGRLVHGACRDIVTSDRLTDAYGINLSVVKIAECHRYACIVPAAGSERQM